MSSNNNFRLSAENLDKARQYIAKLRDEYLDEPTYCAWMEPCGVVQVGELETKRVHRNWWEECYPEIHYGGENLRDYGGEICEFLVNLCARQLGILSEFDKLMEDCCWHDPFDPLEHRWDESLLMNSTGIDEVDEYANELMEELVKDFAFEGAPEFTQEVLDNYVEAEEEAEECPPGCPYCEEAAAEGKS